ncbi:hypothetical protein ACIQC7_34955 [Kitasatospora sp. NPDC088556]|uniref:hypothetical protein n=1 Tax=Kitasatospora sp. NPDC088556 TaxID=3364076 RepID=UPI00381B3FF9
MTMNKRSAGTEPLRVPGAEQLLTAVAAVVALRLAGLLMNQLGRPAPGAGALADALRRVADALDQVERDEQQREG